MRFSRTVLLLLLFSVVLVASYLAAFNLIEYMRHRRGPWEVRFVSDSEGNPAIVVSQRKLQITSIKISFQGEKLAKPNLQEEVVFDRPLRSVPFGKVLQEDLRFLPGAIAFDLFGHEVELLPRTLLLNRKEVSWRSVTNVVLTPGERMAKKPSGTNTMNKGVSGVKSGG